MLFRSTGGLFDPTVIDSMNTLGYDRDFASVIARGAIAAATAQVNRAPGMQDVVLNEEAMTIALPAGVGLDPGAIGKGLACDVVAGELYAAGAAGVLFVFFTRALRCCSWPMRARALCWKSFWDAAFENSAVTADDFVCGLAVAQKPLECLERSQVQVRRNPSSPQHLHLRTQPHAGMHPLQRAHARV